MGEQAVQKPAAQGKFGWLWKILKWTGIIFGSLILLIILLIATLYFHEKKAQKSEYSGKHTALEKIELKRGSRLDLGSVNLNGYQSNFEKPLKIKSAGVSTPQKFKNASLIEASPQKFLYEDTIAFIFDKDIFTVGDVSPEKQHIFIDGLSGYERAQNGSMLKLFVTGNIKYGVKYDGSFQYEGRTLTFSFIKPLLCSAYYNSDRQYYNLYLDDTQNFDELKPLLEQYLFIVAEKDNKKVTAKVIVEKDRYDNIIVRSSLDFPALLKQSLESTDDLVIQNRDHERLKVGNNFSATKFTLQEVRANKRVRDFVVFRFSKRVRPKDFYEKLKISPAPLGVAWETTAANSAQSDDTESEDGEYSEYDEGSAETYGTNEIYLSTASFKPKQVYAFQVKGELRSVDGDLLKEDISLKIEMKNALPVLNLQDGISIVEAAYPYYPVKIRNLEQVDVRIAKLNGKETIDVLKDKLYSNEKLYREGINSYAKVKQARKKYDRYAHEIKSVSLNGAVDNLIQYSKIDLAKPGHYLISVWPSRQDIEREGAILAEMMPKVAFINVTDIGLIAKKSLNEIAVWTTELESGKPKPNQEVVIYDTAHRVIAKGRTGADGFLALQINHKVDKDKLFVTAGNKEDSAVVGLESEYGNGFDANISTWEFGIESWSLKDFLNNYNSRFFLVTDSPIYKPGSEVNYKLYLREYNEKGLDYYRGKKRVEIEVYDPQWEVITRETVTLGKDSSAVGSFRLKSNTKLGGYFIQISTDKNHGRRVAEFLVADYRTPKSKFRVNSDKRYYYPGESAKFTLTADYYFGQPIQNAPININCRYTRNYNAADDENYESYVFYNEDIMFKSSEKTFAQNKIGRAHV